MIHEVYCQKDIPAKQWQDDKLINIEHTWPQSRFGGGGSKSIKKSDLHHLFPTDSQMNNSRGNFKFGDVDGPTKELKCSESRMSDGPKGPRFEPPAVHKGNVARALFYFSVRYDMTIDADEEKTIRRWHELDPVDDAERARNEAIEARQGNRNPFIDHPEFAEQISNF
jgi:endonuclease I